MSEENRTYPKSIDEEEEPTELLISKISVKQDNSHKNNHFEEEKTASLIYENHHDSNKHADSKSLAKKESYGVDKYQEEEKHSDFGKEKENKKRLRELIERKQFKHKNLLETQDEIKTACYIPKKKLDENSIIATNETHREMAVINDEDGRKRVENTTLWPYCAHGIVKIIDRETDKCVSSGTGTVIGPNFVLTAAHNLFIYEKDVNNVYKKTEISTLTLKLVFIPAANGSKTPYGTYEVVDYRYPQEFKDSEDEDYAVLVIKGDISRQTGYIGLHAIPYDQLKDYKNNKFSVYGYPLEKQCYQYGMEEALKEINSNSIKYTKIETSEGQSGSSIYYRDSNENLYIVGVYTGYRNYVDEEMNLGIRLIKDRTKIISDWMRSIVHLIIKILHQKIGFRYRIEHLY